MSAKVPIFPEARSPFLNDMITAFRMTSKALKHSVSSWDLTISDAEAGTERLDCDVVYLNRQIRFSAWDDGGLWFGSCKPGPRRIGGWEFNFALHADAQNHAPEDIVDTFRWSLSASDDPDRAIETWTDYAPQRDRGI